MWIVLFLFGFLIYCVYWKLSLDYQYWEKRGVPSPPATFLFGNLGSTITSVLQIYNNIYSNYPGLHYVGYYKMRTPGIILRDPNLINDVLVKEFNSFHNTDFQLDEKVDPMKMMYPYMEECAKKMTEFIEKEPDSSNTSGMDARELCAKYASDVIASCTFGLNGKSFDEADPEFRRMGKKLFPSSTTAVIKTFLVFIFPLVARLLKIRFFADDAVNYFRQIIKTTLKYRVEHKIIRNDFLDFVLEIKSKPGEYVFSDEDIAAHALDFFTGSFETSSAAMCHALFYLGANPDVQDMLLSEIKGVFQKNNGRFDYVTINEMRYLDAVLCETLRMHPPGLVLLRACTNPFTLPPPHGIGTGSNVLVEVGTPVVIPDYGLHYDPKYYDDPEKFDPSRFLENNKETLTKYTFLPFGVCLGQRLGILESKLAIANIVANFEIKVNKKAITPLEIDPALLIPHPKGGIWLDF